MQVRCSTRNRKNIKRSWLKNKNMLFYNTSKFLASAIPRFSKALDIIRIQGTGLTILYAKMFRNILFIR